MNARIHIPHNARWLSLGIVLTLAATLTYFGSDDWSPAARPWGVRLAFVFYGAGLLVWLRYLLRLSGRHTLAALGVLLGVGALVAARAQLVSNRLAYLGTHPYAFWLNLVGPPIFLDDRALRNWADGILTPYLFLLEVAVAVSLIASGVRGSWQLLRRFRQ